MIKYVSSDLFQSPAQTLVNTVNTKGVMGRGVAERFREIYPEMFAEYRAICERGELEVGTLHLYRTKHKYILNFPTKKHWRNPSKVEYIEAGLQAFVRMYERAGITSVSFPPLGCGNGGLSFDDQVRPLMERYLHRLSIPVFIHLVKSTVFVPEHQQPETMREWLRSMPEDLSFWQVWDDLRSVLLHQPVYRTASKKTVFRAEVVPDANDPWGGIRLSTPTKRWVVGGEQLQSLWQQIRTSGFVSGPEAPAGLARDMSYLGPILSALGYVEMVQVSDDYGGFQRQPRLGIKYVKPKAAAETTAQVRDQADLFKRSSFDVAVRG
jgi:O-acetyl-ADP-ribose deacetylase (regulator of RNase III)